MNEEQEKVLETLLQYMNVSFERVSSSDDFWDSLTLYEKERIQRGLTDAQEGRYSPAQSFLNDLLQK